MLSLGIDRFDFVGGEATLYGKGWFDLATHIRAVGGRHVSVITSGWFLGDADGRGPAVHHRAVWVEQNVAVGGDVERRRRATRQRGTRSGWTWNSGC